MDGPWDKKRSQRRVEAMIPIQVRGTDPAGVEFEDITNAVEVSRRGLSFLTRRDLALFASLYIVIPGRGPVRPDEGPTDFFTEATVVSSKPEDQDWFRIGVRFMGATFPIYCPENSSAAG